jgi:hypothetical protein
MPGAIVPVPGGTGRSVPFATMHTAAIAAPVRILNII